jgi:ABC-type bacteriocin/lantibiotic exporter with double-glycine peptidase domain
VSVLPFQVILALLILYNEIGVATFAGFVTMLLFAALISNNARLLRKYSRQVMGMKDVRMKATTEVLNYMRIIKLQAWEEYFRRKIEECRKGEYRFLRGFQFALSTNITMLGMSTSVVAIVTFSACILIGTNLTAAKVFTVISTFNILSEPIRTFPQAIISISQALVSLQRLDSYMMSKEIEDYVERGETDDSSGCSVIVEGGRFTWDENETTSSSGLSGIDLRIPQGHLVAVVGTVGSGKSSLLAALLGEMPKLSGRVRVLPLPLVFFL